MARYRYVGADPIISTSLHLELAPGDEFDSSEELDSPVFERMVAPKSKPEEAK